MIILVHVPSGSCPVDLVSTDVDDVIDWCTNVRVAGQSCGKHYSSVALKYFARQFYDINSDDWKIVASIINEYLGPGPTIKDELDAAMRKASKKNLKRLAKKARIDSTTSSKYIISQLREKLEGSDEPAT